MCLPLGILLSGLRHAAIGVAVLSVLMMAFRVHLHAHPSAGCGHGHDIGMSLGCAIDDDAGQPSEPDAVDPDGCGSCHCPSSPLMISGTPGIAFHVQVADLARPVHPTDVPDSLSYPPDPPPVRLS